jgi:inner membrane protein
VELLIVLVVLGLPVLVVGAGIFAMLNPELRVRLTDGIATASRSMVGRLALMAGTATLLLIPLAMVDGVRQERGQRLDDVRRELATQWGGAQSVLGPMLVVPVEDHSEERVETWSAGKMHVHMRPVLLHRTFVVFPRKLAVTGDVTPQSLHRGLFDVLVYNADVSIDATFERPTFPVEDNHELIPQWDEARLLVELGDLSALSEVEAFQWGEEELRTQSGALPQHISRSGFHGLVQEFSGESMSANIAVRLRGMDQLTVASAGETTEVNLGGTWSAPSFTGFTLPDTRSVDNETFSSKWSIPGVTRSIPQIVDVTNAGIIDALHGNKVGVRLVEPASAYVSVERAQTYGILVISLCLLTFFVVERVLGLDLHPVQWLVNGLAMAVFYLVLLAGAEHWGFEGSYVAAATVTVSLMTVYTLAASRALPVGAAVGTSLSILYSAMLVMLRSEDHALLMGTGLVVMALGCLMWVTRHLAWAPSRHPSVAPIASK